MSLRPPSVEERFRELAEAWRQGVGPTSSIAELAMHPAYQRIIGLGPGVVPLLLRELKERPAPWIWALEALTGVDPLGPAEKWTFEEVVQAWLKWGREEGFIE
ncbi:MAG: hypothetical protein HYZ53_03720 [Planctomycetes bacterium]|nr:hypothetical protein [Planctomycetota bacterium]